MIAAFRAEWLKLSKRPAVWSLAGAVFGVLVLFVYMPGWLLFAHGPHGMLPAGVDVKELAAGYYPRELIPHFLSNVPALLGAACLALGALTLGSEYAWGSIHTVASLPPGRLTTLAGRLVALALIVLVLNLLLWSVAAGLATAFAVIDGASVTEPPTGRLAAAIATTWLISSMWCGLGVMLAAIFRQSVVALAVGLIYMLVVEGLVLNLLGSTAGDMVRGLERFLPGPNAGALVQAFGHGYMPAGMQAPAPLAGPMEATAALAVYLLMFCLATAYFLRTRDLT